MLPAKTRVTTPSTGLILNRPLDHVGYVDWLRRHPRGCSRPHPSLTRSRTASGGHGKLALLPVRLDAVDAFLREQPGSWRDLIESSRLRAIIGMKTLSSKCLQTADRDRLCCDHLRRDLRDDLGITGLTLPGMIELPFWSSGRRISTRPARGPEPMRRMSFAIFVRETATTLRAPRLRPDRRARRWPRRNQPGARCRDPSPRGAGLEPAPRTRDGCSGRCRGRAAERDLARRGSESCTRAIPWRTCAAYPPNSCPSVTGTASTGATAGP